MVNAATSSHPRVTSSELERSALPQATSSGNIPQYLSYIELYNIGVITFGRNAKIAFFIVRTYKVESTTVISGNSRILALFLLARKQARNLF